MKRVTSSWLQARSKSLRAKMTPQERVVWRLLHNGALRALNWRHQAPFGRCILDFVSHPARLVVEIDGVQHGERDQIEHDKQRTNWLSAQGYRVLRFWNCETKSAQNEIWLTVHAAALETPARIRMEQWRAKNWRNILKANKFLPLDGGGGREAAGGGARADSEDEASRGAAGNAGGPHPLSRAARDSSPIEGEQE